MESTSTQVLGKGVHGNVKGTPRDLSRGPAPSATTGLGDLGEDGEAGILSLASPLALSHFTFLRWIPESPSTQRKPMLGTIR